MSRDINLLYPRLRKIVPQIIAECKALEAMREKNDAAEEKLNYIA